LKNRRKTILVLIPAIFLVVFGAMITTRATPPNVFIIVMDTVRQDRLSAYGYSRATSPNLGKLTQTSRIYHNAYSTSGWTVPAHASLFTGLFAAAHKSTQEEWRLDKGLTTLAEILSENGYMTIGISGNANLRKDSDFDQGFSEYYEIWREPYKSAGKSEGGTREHAALTILNDTLGKEANKEPLFVFINLIEPHSPYNSSGQFRNQFVTDQDIRLEGNLFRAHFLGDRILAGNEINHFKNFSAAEMLYTDYVVGGIVDYLKENRLWDDTIFIVTSDHGENIGDHDMMDHVFSLYESTTKIPLIIHYPELFEPGSEDHTIVQLTDIFPTLLEITGVDTVEHPSQGRNLLEEESGEARAVFTEYYYPRQVLNSFRHRQDSFMLERFKRKMRSITLDNMKLIWGSDGRNELYDLNSDPGETRNLVGDPAYSSLEREMLAGLQRLVDKYSAVSDTSSDSQEETDEDEAVDEETLRELKSLGYVQ